MKVFSLCLALLLCAGMAVAQTPPAEKESVVAGGVSYNGYSAPNVSGTLMYAHRVSSGLYSFTLVDIFSKSTTPFSVATATTTGVAQHVRDIGPIKVYVVGTVGIGAGGQNAGFAWSSGGTAVIPIGSKGWVIMPNIRVLKSSFSDNQAVYGVMFGWGK